MYNLKDLRAVYTIVCPFEQGGSGDGDIARFSKRIKRHINDMDSDLRLCQWEREYLLWNMDECSEWLPAFVVQAIINVVYKDMERVEYDISPEYDSYLKQRLGLTAAEMEVGCLA